MEVIETQTFPQSTITAALKVQKVYRSYSTRRRLADSAVVVEELWWQALESAQLNHTTISFFNFGKSESAASRWNRISLNASKVGKGLLKDVKAQKLAFQHWIEAIDPRHRYGHSLHLYFEQWCKADAGQPFFYWLDTGDGKDVDLKECPRSKLRQQCIKYLGPKEREHYEYVVVEGNIVHKQSKELLDTTKGSQGEKWIFVISTFKKLYVGEKKKGIFHHSSFLAGGVTLAAGRLVAVNGVLKSIWAYSGHYRPTDDNFNVLLDFLKENGVSMDEVEIRSSTEDYENNGDSKSNLGETAVEVPSRPIESSDPKPAPIEIPEMVLKYLPDPDETTHNGSRTIYKRTLSGVLQSPRAEVPKQKLLERIDSKKVASSYQLGHQLSMIWSTGAGPRIGCVADYPRELSLQALEFVNLSPRTPLTPFSPQLACRAGPEILMQEREHYEYIVTEGKIVHKQSGELLDTTIGSQEAKWIFVMSTFNKLYAGEKKKGIFHHSSFLAGGVTLAAGRLVAVNGVLKSIWAYSGHYCPTDDNLNGLLGFLKENGVSMDEVQIRSSTEDYESNGDSKSNLGETAVGVLSNPIESSDPKPAPIEIPKMVLKYLRDPDEVAQNGSSTIYKRTLSGGLQSPRAEVPKHKLLERIDSKKIASSYQLGHQLSKKWSTGAGPRIGCVADYPLELRLQALEFVNLSPRTPLTPSSRQLASLISPPSRMNPDIHNMEFNSQPLLSR